MNTSNDEQSVLDQVFIGGTKSKQPETVVEKGTHFAYLSRLVNIMCFAAVEGTKNAFLYVTLVIGIVGAIVVVYMMYTQFWSPWSPTKIYNDAVKIIRADERCTTLFGSPIAVYGEETSRGRRRHVRYIDYVSVDGTRRIRVMFHLKGPLARGTAMTEIEEVCIY